MARIGKTELIEMISEKTAFTKKDITTIFNAFTDAVQDSIKNGDEIAIPNFGTWSTQEVKERVGRNFRTNEIITIPARRRVKFTAGKALTEAAAFKKVNLKKPSKKKK